MFNLPSHIYWKLDGKVNANYDSISNTDIPNFEFAYINDINQPATTKYASAINNRLIALNQAGKSKLAIFISGKDSEIIAIQCKKLGIDFELYFLNIVGINEYMLTNANLVALTLGSHLNVISLTLADAMSYSESSYELSKVLKPTYLVVPYMFDKIPFDQHIIIGEGDLNKGGKSYELLIHPDPGVGIPILNTEIAYLLHGRKLDRDGDYYFHSSSLELIKTVWHHPLLLKNYPNFSNQKIIDSEWGSNLIFKSKTTNWDSNAGIQLNLKIRNHLAIKYKTKFNILSTIIPKETL